MVAELQGRLQAVGLETNVPKSDEQLKDRLAIAEDMFRVIEASLKDPEGTFLKEDVGLQRELARVGMEVKICTEEIDIRGLAKPEAEPQEDLHAEPLVSA